MSQPRSTLLTLILATSISSTVAARAATGSSRHSNLATLQNIRVTRDSFAAHAEPSLAVNPRNPRNLLGTAQYIGSTRQSARPASFASFDGGLSWHDNGPLLLPAGYTGGDDVSAAFTTAGTGFIAGEVYGSGGGSAIVVWRTLDGGRSFLPPRIVYSSPSTTMNTDHPSVCAAVGPRLYVYLAWSLGTKLLFSRSLDDGVHFSSARAISRPGDPHPDWAVVTVGPAGAVHVVYYAGTAAPFDVANSSDDGAHFGSPISVGTVAVGKGPSINVSTLVGTATEPRTGVLYVSRALPSPTNNHLQILVWRSKDGGHTWSSPASVTTNPSDHFQPQLVVDSSGKVDVAYFTLMRGRVREFLARSTGHGAAFRRHQSIGSAVFDPARGVPGKGETGGKGGGAGWIGDYQGLAAGPGVIYPMWNDARSGHLEIYESPFVIR